MALKTAIREAPKKNQAAKKKQDNITRILSELQSQVNGLQEQQADHQKQLASRPVKELNTNAVLSIMGIVFVVVMGFMATMFGYLKSDINEIKQDVNRLDAKIDANHKEVNDRFDKVNERFDKVNERLDRIYELLIKQKR